MRWKKTHSWSLVEGVAWLILAALLAYLAIGVPVHFRAVSSSLLETGGRGTETVTDLAADALDRGDVGSAALLLEVAEATPRKTQLLQRRDEVLERQPRYAFTGGPDPYYQQFLELIDRDEVGDAPGRVVGNLIPDENRAVLGEFLEFSVNPNVQAVLNTRELTTVVRFTPVRSSSGQPLEIAILLTALLIQSDGMDADLARDFRLAAEAALDGDRRSVDELEELYLAMLSLGRRFDWVSLTELAKNLPSSPQLIDAATLFRVHPEDASILYAAILLAEDKPALFDYLFNLRDEAWEGLEVAVPLGAGAIDLLAAQNKPLYRAPENLSWLDPATAWMGRADLFAFAVENPKVALSVKIALMLAAGFTFTLALGAWLRVIVGHPRINRWHPLSFARNGLFALIWALSLWIILEPAAVESVQRNSARLRLDFLDANQLDALRTRPLQTSLMDQLTLIVIGVFFLLQLIVYIVGLMKLAEIRKMEGTPALKLRLIENEDNLFDLGLYVGLGGTVLSLILLAMEVVETSLVAAYSSTLFGIIFVGALKVVHVRPFRRLLLTQNTRNGKRK